jgi:hypothetical protein
MSHIVIILFQSLLLSKVVNLPIINWRCVITSYIYLKMCICCGAYAVDFTEGAYLLEVILVTGTYLQGVILLVLLIYWRSF